MLILYQDIYVCFYKAYDLVKDWALEDSLRHYFVNEEFIEMISNIYKFGFADIITEFVVTDTFRVS